MQVTLRHRQANLGSFFVDCEIKFSEEERAIIQYRGLGDQAIQLPTGIPHGSGISPGSIPSRLAGCISAFGLVLGVVFVLAGIAVPAMLAMGIVLLLAGGGIFVFVRSGNVRRVASYQPQIITLQQLLSNPVFTIAAADLNEAHSHEAIIRSVLAELKAFLDGNAEIKEVETFEL